MGKVQRLAYFLSDLSPVSYYYFILLVLYLLGPCPLGLISDIGASCPVFFFRFRFFFRFQFFFRFIQIQIQSGDSVVVERALLQTLSVVAATMLLLRYDVHSGPTVFLCQGCTTTLHCFG